MATLSPTSTSFSSTSYSDLISESAFRIALLGGPEVGKTALINQLINKEFLRAYLPTVQERYLTGMEVDGQRVSLDIFDTPGSYCFRNVRQLAITNADAFVLMYSVEDESSFEIMARHRHMVVEQKRAGVPIIVVGNKSDMKAKRFVSEEKARCMVTTGWEHCYMESYAGDEDSVHAIFHEIVKKARQFLKQEKRRMTAPVQLLNSIRKRLRRTKTIH